MKGNSIWFASFTASVIIAVVLLVAGSPSVTANDQPSAANAAVNIDNFAGFTGVADAGAGDAKATFANGTYTVTGTAQGSKLDDPRISFAAPFKIEVGC